MITHDAGEQRNAALISLHRIRTIQSVIVQFRTLSRGQRGLWGNTALPPSQHNRAYLWEQQDTAQSHRTAGGHPAICGLGRVAPCCESGRGGPKVSVVKLRSSCKAQCHLCNYLSLVRRCRCCKTGQRSSCRCVSDPHQTRYPVEFQGRWGLTYRLMFCACREMHCLCWRWAQQKAVRVAPPPTQRR